MEEYLQQITRLMNLNGEAVEGMMVVNKDGIVEYYKPGNPFGKLPEEFGRNVVGNHLLSVYTELSEENSTVMNTLRTGQITVGEKQVLTHEDLQITMVTTTYPILNQQGEIQGAVDIAQILDVRSLKGAAPASADHSVPLKSTPATRWTCLPCPSSTKRPTCPSSWTPATPPARQTSWNP